MRLHAGVSSLHSTRFFFRAVDAWHPRCSHRLMVLLFVPFTHPNDLFWSGRYLANWACFGFAGFSVLDCSLYPCGQRLALSVWQLLADLSVGVPIKPCQQMLMIGSGRKSACLLVLGFQEQGLFQFPPRVPQSKGVGVKVWCLGSCPVKKLLDRPLPFLEIGYGCRHGSFDDVPWMGFGLQLLVGLAPCLL